jgi:trk system potassium uptake protein TrkA
MKIIIAGAGAVGTHLAKLLAKENMDVILLDKEEEPLEQMTFLNMMTLVGSPTSIKTLKDSRHPQREREHPRLHPGRQHGGQEDRGAHRQL